MPKLRKISQIIDPQFVIEGAGVKLRRSISPNASNQHDPFLLFDHFAFNDPVEGPIKGFPTHPHRGIETVTYMLEGSVAHRDSMGNSDLIGPGDIQWMTAGGGILHEEMPRRGPNGAIYGFQLWVNLPAKLKMCPPAYRGLRAEDIPTYEKDGVKARIVAGELNGVKGPVVEIAANPLYMDVTLSPNSDFSMPVPFGHTLRMYVFEGSGTFGIDEAGSGESVSAVKMLIFGDGDGVRVKAGDEENVRFMVMAGAPFKETIFPYGPFVMNTREEIIQALNDLQNGTFVKTL